MLIIYVHLTRELINWYPERWSCIYICIQKLIVLKQKACSVKIANIKRKTRHRTCIHMHIYITNVYLTSFNLLVASNPVSKIWVTVIYLQYSQAYSILRLASLFTQPIKKIDFNLCLTIEGKVYIIRQSSVRIQYWPSTANGYTPSGMTNLLFVLFLLLTRWCAF